MADFDPYKPWRSEPTQTTVIELPKSVMARLVERAKAAGFQNETGEPDVLPLLWRACKAHAGCICDDALDEIAKDGTDPDMQALRIAVVRAAMERDRAN